MSNEAFEKWFENTVLNDNIHDVAEWAWQAAKVDSESILSEQQNTIAELKANTSQIVQAVSRAADAREAGMENEIIALQAHNTAYRKTVEEIASYESDKFSVVSEICEAVLQATPAQSLQAHDNDLIEKCAIVCDGYTHGAWFADKIRALKGLIK